MGKLTGKVALVTGAARGQGRSHAVGLAKAGADVVAVDICAQIGTVAYPMADRDDLDETVRMVEEHDRRAISVVGDVREVGTMRHAVSRAVGELGRVDIVLANAGIMNTVGPAGDDDQAFYDSIVERGAGPVRCDRVLSRFAARPRARAEGAIRLRTAP